MKIDNKLILESSKGLNILYVEDDELLRESTSQLFVNFFNKVDVAIDGEDGLKKYKDFIDTNGSAYDIVISDINMPNMDGLEMCKKIKDENYDQVIIFITAFNESNYLHSAISLGVHGFLTKPIEMDQLKNVLYRTSQVVTDRRLVQKHYEQLEEQNIENLKEYDNGKFSSSKDILKDLEKDKNEILNTWGNNLAVQEKLSSHNIDISFFKTHYGAKVIEYFLGVIKGEEEIGNCPVVMIMLDFFKNKNLPLEDVFIVCVNFKNTVTSYVFDKYSFNQKLFDEISLILDRNFEGVIINYQKQKKNTSPVNPKVNSQVIKQVKEVKEEKPEELIYSEYVLETDVYELQDLEEEIDSLAVLVTMNNNATIEDNELLGSQIKRYGVILTNYPLFSKLGDCIMRLGINFKENAQLLFDDRQRMESITALIEGFVNDLIIWRKEIFDNNIEDPHFLDDSFFSNVDTIIMFIQYNESEDVGGDDNDEIEFF